MRRLSLVALFLMATLLAGCGNPGLSSDAAAKAYINALFSGNIQGARDTLCTRAKPLLGDDAAVITGTTAETPIDVSGLSYSVRDATDTTATVVVSGKVKVGTGAAQQEVDFATIGAAFTALPAVVEDNAWKICPASF